MEDKTNDYCVCNSPFCPSNLTEVTKTIVSQFNNVDEATIENIFDLFDSFNIDEHQPEGDGIDDYDAFLDLFENPSWALWERQFLNV